MDRQIFRLGIHWPRMRRTAGNVTMQYRSSPSFKDVLPSRDRLLHMSLKIQNIRDVSCFVITRLYELWSQGWGLSLFWDVTLRKLVFGDRRFAITCRSIFKVQAAILLVKKRGKAVSLQAWSGPEGSRKLRFPDYMTTAQDGGKVVSLTHWPPLPPGNAPCTHFC